MPYERRTDAAWAIHPGQILKKEFLQPLKLSAYRLAKEIDVPPQAINEITHYKRGISANLATRLAKFFGTSEQFWMNLQIQFDLARARQENRVSLRKIRRFKKAA